MSTTPADTTAPAPDPPPTPPPPTPETEDAAPEQTVLANDLTKTAAFENYPVNLLTRGDNTSAGAPVATGAFITQIVSTADFNTMQLEATLLAGAANGDLAVQVFPVDAWGNVMSTALTPEDVSGPTFTSPNVYYQALYDVHGQNQVQISIKNNNAASKNIAYNYKLT